jgi:predicted ATPase
MRESGEGDCVAGSLETTKRTQLIVATHSERFIHFLKFEEVVVMDLDDAGCATAVWADTLDLEKWLDEYSLDEVWSSLSYQRNI